MRRSWWRSEDSEPNFLVSQREFGSIRVPLRLEGECRSQFRFWIVWLSCVKIRVSHSDSWLMGTLIHFFIGIPESWFLVEAWISMYFRNIRLRFSRLCCRWSTFGVLDGRWLGLSQFIERFWIPLYYLSSSTRDLCIYLANTDFYLIFIFFLHRECSSSYFSGIWIYIRYQFVLLFFPISSRIIGPTSWCLVLFPLFLWSMNFFPLIGEALSHGLELVPKSRFIKLGLECQSQSIRKWEWRIIKGKVLWKMKDLLPAMSMMQVVMKSRG